MKVKIVHAAVFCDKSFMMFMGKCHADCFRQAASIGLFPSSKARNQGFITNSGLFVHRDQAHEIAIEAKQIEPNNSKYLFSEDLWSKTCGGKFDYETTKGYFLNEKT